MPEILTQSVFSICRTTLGTMVREFSIAAFAGVTWEMLGRFSLIRAVEMGDIQFERILPGGTAAQTLHACVSCSACSTT